MNKLLSLLSGLIAVGLIAFGFYALVATTVVTGMTGLVPDGIAGLNEARAIYAGSFWAMGGLVLYALATPGSRQPLLMGVGVVFAGFVAGRIASIAMDGYDARLTGAIGAEVVSAIILIAASRASGSAASA